MCVCVYGKRGRGESKGYDRGELLLVKEDKTNSCIALVGFDR